MPNFVWILIQLLSFIIFQVSETDFYNNRKLRESETYKDATKRNASYFDHSYQHSCLVYCKLYDWRSRSFCVIYRPVDKVFREKFFAFFSKAPIVHTRRKERGNGKTKRISNCVEKCCGAQFLEWLHMHRISRRGLLTEMRTVTGSQIECFGTKNVLV